MRDRFGRAVLELTTDNSGLSTGLDTAEREIVAKAGAIAKHAKDFAERHRESFIAIGQAATIAAGAIAAIGTAVFALGQRGAEVADVADGFRLLTADLGDADQTLAELSKAVDGTVSNFQLMRAVNQGFSQGLRLTRDELTLTGETARILADRIGGDTRAAFEQLMTAMSTGRDRGLALIGMNIDATAAVERFAQSIGKSTRDLTENEQILAKRTAILEQMRREVEATGGVEADFADRITQAKVAVENFTDSLGVAIATNPAVNAALDSVSTALLNAFGQHQVAAVQALSQHVSSLALLFVDVARVGVAAADALTRAFYGVRALLFALLEDGVSKWRALADQTLLYATALREVTKIAAPFADLRPFDLALGKLANLRQQMAAIGESFGQTKDEALDASSAWQATFATLDTNLVKLRAEMARLAAEGVSVEDIARALLAPGQAAGVSAAELRKAAAEAKRFADAVRAFGQQGTAFGDAVSRGWFGPLTKNLEDTVSLFSRTTAEAGQLRQEAERWAFTHGAVLAPAIEQVNARLEEQSAAAATVSQTWQENLSRLAQAFGTMAQVSDSTFDKVTGGIARTLTSVNALAASFSTLKDGFGSLAGGFSFSGLMNAASGIVGIIGTVTNLFRGMFGVSPEIKAARENLEQFQQTLRDSATDAQRLEAANSGWADRGALDAIRVRDLYLSLGRTAEEAARDVAAMWDTDNPERSAAAIARVNDAMKEHQRLVGRASDLYSEIMDMAEHGVTPAIREQIEAFINLGLLTEEQAAALRGIADTSEANVKKMEAASQLFQGRLEALGPAFQQAKLNETAAEYINAFDDMIRGGADLGGILFDAKEEFSALVAEAIAGGKTLPANMKPWIEELHRAGLLVDANGEKIEDISGIQWGEAMKTEAERAEEGWNRILEMLREVLDEIRGIDRAVDSLPDEHVIRVRTDTSGVGEFPQDGRGDGIEPANANFGTTAAAMLRSSLAAAATPLASGRTVGASTIARVSDPMGSLAAMFATQREADRVRMDRLEMTLASALRSAAQGVL